MAVNKRQTVDIVEDLVSLINTEITGKSAWVDNGDNTYTINICNTYWLNTMEIITINSVEYTIEEVIKNTSLKVGGVSFPTSTSFFLDVPTYYHGTVIQTNQEISNDTKNVTARTPMVYLLEVIEDNFLEDDNLLDRTSDLRLFFLTEANFEDWKTDQHYLDAIEPMRSMVDFFISEVLKKSKGLGKIEGYDVINHANFGVYTTDKGHTKKIFNDDYSGCELRITLPIKSDYSCGCDGVYSKIKYIDSDGQVKSSNYGSTIVCTPSGGGLINVSNSNDTYSVNTSIDLELPDITHTNSDGSPLTLPAQTPFVATECPVIIGSSEPFKTGQTTSYTTGDDGDLELGNGIDFYTLSNLNGFGSTYRFTDLSGNDWNTGTPTGSLIIDWSTYNPATNKVAVWSKSLAADDTWVNQVAWGLLDNLGTGFTDGWHLPNTNEAINVMNFETANLPVFFDNSGFDFWLSTTDGSNSSNAYYCRLAKSIQLRAKTNSEGARQLRYYTLTELGL